MKLTLKHIIPFFTVLLCSIVSAYASDMPSLEWSATYNAPGYTYDKAGKIAVGPSGSVYVTGTSGGTSQEMHDQGNDYLTIKYSPSGVKLWEARYNGPGNGFDVATAIAVDSAENVYVTGYSLDAYGRIGYATIKYSPDGIRQWVQRDDIPRDNYPSALVVDTSGNVYVTGSAARRAQVEWTTPLSWTSGYDWLTIKYDTNGEVLWKKVYDAPEHGDDGASAMSVDASGNVYVVGAAGGGVYGDNIGTNFTTLKYNSDGTLQWVATYDGPQHYIDVATAVALDSSGNVYITGYSNSYYTNQYAAFDYATIKYNPNGIQQWVRIYNGIKGGNDVATQILLNPEGNIYVTGYSKGSGTDHDITTLQYDTDGVQQWVTRFNGTGNGIDIPSQAAMDSNGKLYITGYSKGSDSGYDIVTIRYNSSGEEEWKGVYNSDANNDDYPAGIAIDNNDNIYITGSTLKTDTSFDYITIKYGGPSRYSLEDVRVIDTISTNGIELDPASFSKTPYSIVTTDDKTMIEWRFDTFSVNLIEDLSFDVILKSPVSGEQRQISHKVELLYNDVSGNPVRTELDPQYVTVLNSAFDSSVLTDKTTYQANEDVAITPKITNLSEYARTIDAKVSVEDKQGNSVKEIAVLSNLYFTAGETKNLGNLAFNTASNYAGDYIVHIALYENQKQVGETTVGFKIQPAITLNSRIATDKTSYNPNEQVAMNSTVTSTSPNYIFENLKAKTEITTHYTEGTKQVYTDTKAIPILIPDQFTEFKAYWNTGDNTPGVYTATLTVTSSTGEILSTSQTTFEILSTSQTGSGLKGSISASPSQVSQGEKELLTYSITNSGNSDLLKVSTKLLIIDSDTQETKAEASTQRSAVKGETITGTQTFLTSNLTSGTYLAILQAEVDGNIKTLASTFFEVLPTLEIKQTIPDYVKALVWINDGCEKDGDQGSGGSGRTEESCIRKDLVEKALDEIGVIYRIVMDKKEFQVEVRNNIYTDYLILGDFNPIEDGFVSELRERVYSGKGLISSLWHTQRISEEIFGVTAISQLPGKDYPVEIVDGMASTAQTISTSGKATRINVSVNAQNILGWISETTKKGTNKYPALVRNEYGNGKAFFYAFDLGLSINEANYTSISEILRASLDSVHRPAAENTSYMPYDLVPLRTEIKSLGGSFDLKMTESYPTDVKLFNLSTEQWTDDNPWMEEIHLDANKTKEIDLLALMPDVNGTYTFSTDISYLEGGEYKTYQTIPSEINIEKDSYVIIGEILYKLGILNLSLTGNGVEYAKAQEAEHYMEGVRDRVINTKEDIGYNIRDILKAIDAVLMVESTEVQDIRLDMDRLLWIYDERWYVE